MCLSDFRPGPGTRLHIGNGLTLRQIWTDRQIVLECSQKNYFSFFSAPRPRRLHKFCLKCTPGASESRFPILKRTSVEDLVSRAICVRCPVTDVIVSLVPLGKTDPHVSFHLVLVSDFSNPGYHGGTSEWFNNLLCVTLAAAAASAGAIARW